MELIIFESDAYYKMVAEQAKLFKEAVKEAKQESAKEARSGDDWLTLSEAQVLLPYRSRTKWQKLRDTGTIIFSQFGRKILYSRNSIMEFIKKNKV